MIPDSSSKHDLAIKSATSSVRTLENLGDRGWHGRLVFNELYRKQWGRRSKTCLKPLSPRLNESFVGFSFPRDSRSEFAGVRWDDLVVVGVGPVTLASKLGWFLVVSPEPLG